jgi:23S rRNA U2552 (ribose-2'-O)-methylase RlmE/FtsJ
MYDDSMYLIIFNVISSNTKSELFYEYEQFLNKLFKYYQKRTETETENENYNSIFSWYDKYGLRSNNDNKPDDFNSLINEQLVTFDAFDKDIKYQEISQVNPKLLNIQVKLNYCKSVMDTKPNTGYELNATVNNELNKYEFISWEHFISILDPYREVKYVLKKRYNAETVSNAWVKMYELLSMFDQFTTCNNKDNLNSFHLCEAPGAFISALNHYLSSNKPTIKKKWNWYAQTLNTNELGAFDDYFGLIKSYPDKWLFGTEPDSTGDITHEFIINYYKNHPQLTNINFMTSDAGTYIPPKDFNSQEKLSCKLNYSQIVAILACLAINGNAVFKTFLPMVLPITRSLIYLLCHHFEKIHIVKPLSSRPTNSEIYIVLLNYKTKCKPELLNELLSFLPKIESNYSLFDKYDTDFVKSYENIITNAIKMQIKSLESSYYYYYHLDQISPPDTKRWFSYNKVKPLLDADKLIV